MSKSHSSLILFAQSEKHLKTEFLFRNLFTRIQKQLKCDKVKNRSSTSNIKMFTMLKSIPNLLGAKVEIKYLYFDQNEGDVETAFYDQAIVEKLSPKIEINRLVLTLSHCLKGIKRVPGIHHYGHVVMVKHLRVIKEGHSDVDWEPKLYSCLCFGL
jgi:hypothetical protein